MQTAPSTRAFMPSDVAKETRGFQLRFNSLFKGPALSFPCDVSGAVDVDALREQARGNLARARNGIGRDYSVPQVLPV